MWFSGGLTCLMEPGNARPFMSPLRDLGFPFQSSCLQPNQKLWPHWQEGPAAFPIHHAPPNLSDEQASAYRHLREAYVGPESGTEEILATIPSLQYVLGMLFPPEDRSPTVETTADVEEGDVEEEELEPLAEEWRPSSAAISFVTDAGAVEVGLDFGTYRPFITAGTDDDKARWKRTPARIQNVTFTAAQMDPVVKLIDGIEVELGCRWRNHGESISWLQCMPAIGRS